MKKQIIILATVVFTSALSHLIGFNPFGTSCMAFSQDAANSPIGAAAYTQQDRERSIRMEVKIEEMYKRFELIDKRFEQIDKRFEQIDKRFERIDSRFDRIESSQQWQFNVLISAMLILVGFILWDRRTFLKPFQLKVEDVETSVKTEKTKTDNLLSALRELAKVDSKVAQVLKQFNLL